jgi:hypothetical protein
MDTDEAASLSLQNPIATDAQLRDTPSQKDGVGRGDLLTEFSLTRART